MEKVRYMISDAAQMAGVESHVLRYWEEELGLNVPRNELGHRYYTRENIAEFQKIKELKARGYQLRAIKEVLHNKSADMEVLAVSGSVEEKASDKLAQFTEIMTDIVGHAIALNNEELSQQISLDVSERVLKEIDYLSRMQEEAAEERYRKLDAAIRGKKSKKLLFEKKKKESDQSQLLTHPQTI